MLLYASIISGEVVTIFFISLNFSDILFEIASFISLIYFEEPVFEATRYS